MLISRETNNEHTNLTPVLDERSGLGNLPPGDPPASLRVEGPQLHEELPPVERPVVLEPLLGAVFVHVRQVVAEAPLEAQQLGGDEVQRPVDRGLAHELPGADELAEADKGAREREADAVGGVRRNRLRCTKGGVEPPAGDKEGRGEDPAIPSQGLGAVALPCNALAWHHLNTEHALRSIACSVVRQPRGGKKRCTRAGVSEERLADSSCLCTGEGAWPLCSWPYFAVHGVPGDR